MWVAAALLTAMPAEAQVAINRTRQYLFASDVADARGVWVNPAGPGYAREASIMLDVTVRDPGDKGRLGQVTAGFASRGLSFGYQRDEFDGGTTAHTYRLALATASGPLALGGAIAMYRGDASASGWDIGLGYAYRPWLRTAVVVQNLGQPVVRGIRQELAVVPAVTLAPWRGRLALSAQGRQAERLEGYAFGASWRWAVPVPGALFTRLDTDRGLRRAAFAFGVAFGGLTQVGTVVTASGDLAEADAASLYGVMAQPLDRRR